MAELSPEQEIGIAIVGCGQIVTHHCKALSAVKNVRVEALCDPSNERRQVIRTLCQEYDILSSTLSEYNTLDDLLSDTNTNTNTNKIDAVQVIFIAVPHDLHVSITCQALDANKHVVLEKPLAPTIESCRELQTASRKSQGLLIVAEQSPYWQEIVKAKALLEEGKIGRLVSAASYYYESMRDNVTSGLDADGGLGWRCSLKRCGGGIVIDGGLHWMRPLRELCGDITSVVGVTQNCEAGLGLEGETLAHAIFKIKHKYEYEYEYDDANDNNNNNKKNKHKDLLATFSANMMHTAPMCHDAAPYFRLTGTKGELVIAGTGLNPNGGGGLRLYDNEHPNGYDLFPKDRQGGFFLGFQGLWNTVVKILRENDNEAAQKTVRDAAADVALALAIYKSSETGNWETCELFDN